MKNSWEVATVAIETIFYCWGILTPWEQIFYHKENSGIMAKEERKGVRSGKPLEKQNWVWKQKREPLDDLPLEYVSFVLNLQMCHLLAQLVPDILEVSNCPKGPLGSGWRWWLDPEERAWKGRNQGCPFWDPSLPASLGSFYPLQATPASNHPYLQMLSPLCLPIMATMIFRKMIEPSSSQRMT